MAKIRMNREADCAAVSVEELLRSRGAPEEQIRALPKDALAARMRIYEEGTETSPQLFESQVPPNLATPIHSHAEDEIIYVLEGEMLFGANSYAKGSSIFVAANTQYGFRAGPQGVRFLNFRPRRCDF